MITPLFSTYSSSMYTHLSEHLPDDPKYAVSLYARILNKIAYLIDRNEQPTTPISVSELHREVTPGQSRPTIMEVVSDLRKYEQIDRMSRAYMEGNGDGRYVYSPGKKYPEGLINKGDKAYAPLYTEYLTARYRCSAAGQLLYHMIYRHSQKVCKGKSDYLCWGSRSEATRDLDATGLLGTKKNSQGRHGPIYNLLEKFEERGWIEENPETTGYAYEIRLGLQKIAEDLKTDVEERYDNDGDSLSDGHFVIPALIDLENACLSRSVYRRRYYSPCTGADEVRELLRHIEFSIIDLWDSSLVGKSGLWCTEHNLSESSRDSWETMLAGYGGLEDTKEYFSTILQWLHSAYGENISLKWRSRTGRADMNNLPTAPKTLIWLDQKVFDRVPAVHREERPQDKGEWSEPDYDPEEYGVERI